MHTRTLRPVSVAINKTNNQIHDNFTFQNLTSLEERTIARWYRVYTQSYAINYYICMVGGNIHLMLEICIRKLSDYTSGSLFSCVICDNCFTECPENI